MVMAAGRGVLKKRPLGVSKGMAENSGLAELKVEFTEVDRVGLEV